MSTVADQLRQAREAKNLTVEQLAEQTKVRTDHIRALEDGRFHVFSATIYIRGSVKACARSLKLDEAQMLATLDAELKNTQKFSEPPPLTETKKSLVDDIALLVAKLNWRVGFLGIGIIAAVIVTGFIILAIKHHEKSDPLKNLPPAVYVPANTGDTLPLPKK
ncbi:MAG TPA: helix-turn-helix domain-containing protein [Verrucomicrobiae bacterium]